jgi:hypothetical protein
VLLDALQNLIMDADGFQALQQLLNFSPDERKTLFDYFEYFKKKPTKGKGKSSKKGKRRKKKD